MSETPFQPQEYVRIGTTGTTFPGDAEAAAETFRRFHAVSLRDLLEPALLATLQRLSDTGTFIGDVTEPGHRQVEAPQRAGRVLNLTLQRPAFLSWLSQVTGCGPLGRVEGRVTQAQPGTGEALAWHDDLDDDGRKLAIVILLGAERYEGGDFELRAKGGSELLSFHHSQPGSALIFQVNSTLEHRVLPLTAGGPRRVFAGWAFGPHQQEPA